MILPYVYKITLLSTGHYYWGSRTANVRHRRSPEDDLWISYFTSSRTVKRLVAEHGRDAFVADVGWTNADCDAVYWYEQDRIKESIDDPLCLNNKFQDRASGNTIFSTSGKTPWNKGVASKTKGIARSDDVKAKISAGRRGKGLGISPVHKGKTLWSEEQRAEQSAKMTGRLVGDKNGFFGKTHSIETRAKIAANTSLHQKGRPKPRVSCPHCGQSVTANTLPMHIRHKHITHDA
jgi:hypothetical protein